MQLIFQHYERFDARHKGLLPLRRAYVPEAIEFESDGNQRGLFSGAAMPKPKKERILSLNLMREYFDAIADGAKKTEFREYKPYWRTRLEGRKYDEIHFRNGYSAKAPFMRVQFLGVRKRKTAWGVQFAISLGKVVDLKHYKCR